jgi:phage tail-like protein
MSNRALHGYRFDTEAQWSQCLFSGADRDSREARSGLRPFVPYAQPVTRFETHGGYAPTIAPTGEIKWRDGDARLQRVSCGDETARAIAAPFAIAHATRLVATSSALWAAGEAPESLQLFDADSLTRQLVIEIPGAEVLDIAGDGHDGVYVLIKRHGAREVMHYDCTGHLRPASSFLLKDVEDASELVFLKHGGQGKVGQLVILASQRAKLHWIDPASRCVNFTISITMLRPCFMAATQGKALGSDGRARLLLTGTDGDETGERFFVITVDAEGNLLGEIEIDGEATGVAGDRKNLLVTTRRGLLQYRTGGSVPRESSALRCALLTPMLQSPATEDARRWLRIEATAHLPAGSTLEISYAATDDGDDQKRAQRLAGDASIPASRRLQQLRSQLADWKTITFHGDESRRFDEPVPFAAPLFDVQAQYLWVIITLIASPGGGIPSLTSLVVLYPGQTLMEKLPGIYQRDEAQPGSFLRAFVGVLESTTQTLDARIAQMGSRIHPNTASDDWLDYVARWLGLPWDDALALDQKRRIAVRGAEITARRGTRAGLEALLECLMPEKPRRFRIVDGTADFGRAMVGGNDCAGSRLPAILGGLPATATELGNKAILGRARLPCPDSNVDTSQCAGHVRVDVSVNADEQRRWQPWLRTLIDEMVPATARVQLRWLSAAAFSQDMKLEETLTLDATPLPHLGTDAVTGIAYLPGRRGISLSGPGLDSDFPLQ